MSDGPLSHIESPYTREELIDGLEYCYEKHGNITKSTINADDDIPFSSFPVQTTFGTFDDAREAIGLERNGYGSQTGFTIDAIEEAPEADQYVYVIKLAREDDETFYYTGSVNGDKYTLSRRISSHKHRNGDCRAPVLTDGGEVIEGKNDLTRQNQYEFAGIEFILPVDGGNDVKRLREVERRTACMLAGMYGRFVLGGR